MRADRLLSILLLLQTHRQLTARDLAQRLEVSDRTIYRDMDALCVAGIPIYAERGQGGGWFLAEDYRMQMPSLSPGELQALALVKPQRLLEDLGLQQLAETALTKLVAALPVRSSEGSRVARSRTAGRSAGAGRQGQCLVSGRRGRRRNPHLSRVAGRGGPDHRRALRAAAGV
jgi:predicted DNA-binding transcriptional regulator YafY